MARGPQPITRILGASRFEIKDKNDVPTGKYGWSKPQPLEMVKHKRNPHPVPVYRGMSASVLRQLRANAKYHRSLQSRAELKQMMASIKENSGAEV